MKKEKIVNRVQEMRMRKGATQEEMAKTLKISRQTVIAIEKGNYTPSVCLALQIAKYFKAQVERVFKICS